MGRDAGGVGQVCFIPASRWIAAVRAQGCFYPHFGFASRWIAAVRAQGCSYPRFAMDCRFAGSGLFCPVLARG